MAQSQIEDPIGAVGFWAEHGRSFEYFQDTGMHDTVLGPVRRVHHYSPVGVVGTITP
jgi:aldehyde dehydrogenase (NAD+)